MQDTDLQEDIAAVAACGPIKVWSVVVTVLGDLCQAPDDHIPGRVLGQLVARMGITNQALRVAQHRLRRDGWIVTERDGRRSNVLLSDWGWKMTQAARGAVYGAVPDRGPVLLAVAPPGLAAAEFAEMLPDEAVILSARAALLTGAEAVPDGCLTAEIKAGACPGWVAEAVAPEVLCAEYQRLETVVRSVLEGKGPTALADRAALRLVILHQWRRLRLRHGDLPDLLLSADWPGARAREQVLAALERFERPTRAVLRNAELLAG